MADSDGTDVLARQLRRGYGWGSVATGAFGTVPGLLLLPYLTDQLGVGPALAGVIVFAPKAWDVILNPIAGRISDLSKHPDGPRRPFLIRFGLALALAFVLLFAGPTSPTALAAAWVAVAYLACASAYSFFQVPYVAMPAEITDDPDERTRLMTWRVAILAFAILVSGGAAPAIRDAFPAPWGYRAVGLFVGGLIAIGAYAAWRGTRGAPIPVVDPSVSAGGLRGQLALVRADRPFRVLLGTFVVQALAIGAMLAGVDYLARYVIGTKLAATLLFLCFVGPALIVTPLWERYGVRRGKLRSYYLATALLFVGALALYLVRGMPTLMYLSVAVVGLGYAGAQMFPMAMLPDVASRNATTRSRVGLYTGVWTAGETLGLALGPGLYAAVLAIGGYRASAGAVTNSTVPQTDSAITAIVIGASLIPAIIFALSPLVLRHYDLTDGADT